jgi:hypothetical protein
VRVLKFGRMTIRMYMHIRTHEYLHKCMHVLVYASACLHVRIYTSMLFGYAFTLHNIIYIYMCVCVFVYMPVCMPACIYMSYCRGYLTIYKYFALCLYPTTPMVPSTIPDMRNSGYPPVCLFERQGK